MTTMSVSAIVTENVALRGHAYAMSEHAVSVQTMYNAQTDVWSKITSDQSKTILALMMTIVALEAELDVERQKLADMTWMKASSDGLLSNFVEMEKRLIEKQKETYETRERMMVKTVNEQLQAAADERRKLKDANEYLRWKLAEKEKTETEEQYLRETIERQNVSLAMKSRALHSMLKVNRMNLEKIAILREQLEEKQSVEVKDEEDKENEEAEENAEDDQVEAAEEDEEDEEEEEEEEEEEDDQDDQDAEDAEDAEGDLSIIDYDEAESTIESGSICSENSYLATTSDDSDEKEDEEESEYDFVDEVECVSDEDEEEEDVVEEVEEKTDSEYGSEDETQGESDEEEEVEELGEVVVGEGWDPMRDGNNFY